MKYILCLLIMTTCSYCLQAQTTITTSEVLKRYNEETLHFNRGHISKGENGPILTGADLKKEFETSSLARETFATSRRARTTGIIFFTAATACLITSSILLNQSRDKYSGVVLDRSKRDLSTAFLIGFIGTYAVSVPFITRSVKKRNTAIWIRNRDVLVR